MIDGLKEFSWDALRRIRRTSFYGATVDNRGVKLSSAPLLEHKVIKLYYNIFTGLEYYFEPIIYGNMPSKYFR